MIRAVPAGAVLLCACAPDLRPDEEAADTGLASTEYTVDGVVFATLDATSEEAWVPYPWSDGAAVDLSFQRYRVALADGVQVARLVGADFDALDAAPADGWLTDAADPVADEDYALHEWYDYDPVQHTLSPADEVVVVRSPDGVDRKLQFLAYYDDAGTPAVLSFQWAVLGGAR